MLAPMAADLIAGNSTWTVFLQCAAITMLIGGGTSAACANGVGQGLDVRQTFLLTVVVWLFLPLFGSLPLMLGPPNLSFTDAFFEAMSGLTTTGATVVSGLDDLPHGILLWRGTLQWLGGVGIIVVAMVFLPELKVGGMQIFKSESFDTMGKILPRAAEIANRISVVYIALTVACAMSYSAAGMEAFDALVHAMTTIATGGMANTDASFSAFNPAIQYIASGFMILAALPFVRYVQLLGGATGPIWRDSQVRVFLITVAVLVGGMTFWLMQTYHDYSEVAFRESLFNVVSIMTGTGYASADYMLWGAFPVVAFFFIGLIGGCAGSTACSIKIFRYQLLFSSIRAQVRKLHAPHGIFQPRYEGHTVSEDVLDSVMAFFMVFIVTMGILSVLLSLTGLDFITSVSGAATAVANIGPGLGSEIGPSGNFAGLNTTAKWILSLGMFVGRLEIIAVLTLFTVAFWRG